VKPAAPAPLVVGLAGGTASGKTWLARHLAEKLGPRRCVVIPHDHYYRDHPGLTAAQRRVLDFDRPAAFETTLLLRHLRELRAGRSVAVPRYRFDISRRAAETDLVAPAPIILVEGLFVLADARLRRALDLKLFVHTPADVRLLRRIRRDTTERRHPLAEVLTRYETHARPGHERYIEPSRAHADLVWDQLADKAFPARILARLKSAANRGKSQILSR
jgi:uridine kinase